jgi:hypothetical protein
MIDSTLSWGLTTAVHCPEELINQAVDLSKEFGCPYLPRERFSLAELKKIHELEYILILDRNQRLFMLEPELFWHPGMAVPRLRSLWDGAIDPFLQAADIQAGDRVLDCTLGLATDALIAAWATGSSGQVLGLEASPLIALITQWGLQKQPHHYESKKVPITQLVSRIQIKNILALDFLRSQPDQSWDIIYFDPMFRATINRSSGLNGIRPIACYADFDQESLQEALRVCRKRVILKERSFSMLFAKLDCPYVQKSKSASVAYGIWERRA